MSVLIDNPETDTLVQKLTATTGESPDVAINNAMRERLERLRTPEQREFMARMKEITDRVAAMPVLDARTADEIIGYNEHGLFD